MINAVDLKERMNTQPFKPFRICMSDGKSYEITNHDMMFVKRNAVLVGMDLDDNSIAERLVECALLHITRIEDMTAEQAA